MSSEFSLSLSIHQALLPLGQASAPAARSTTTPATSGNAGTSRQGRPAESAAAPSEARSKPESVVPDGQELSSAVEHLNHLVKNLRHELQFSVDEATGRTVINVRDKETDELIRQIPPEQILNLAAHFEDSQSGLVRAQV